MGKLTATHIMCKRDIGSSKVVPESVHMAGAVDDSTINIVVVIIIIIIK